MLMKPSTKKFPKNSAFKTARKLDRWRTFASFFLSLRCNSCRRAQHDKNLIRLSHLPEHYINCFMAKKNKIHFKQIYDKCFSCYRLLRRKSLNMPLVSCPLYLQSFFPDLMQTADQSNAKRMIKWSFFVALGCVHGGQEQKPE